MLRLLLTEEARCLQPSDNHYLLEKHQDYQHQQGTVGTESESSFQGQKDGSLAWGTLNLSRREGPQHRDAMNPHPSLSCTDSRPASPQYPNPKVGSAENQSMQRWQLEAADHQGAAKGPAVRSHIDRVRSGNPGREGNRCLSQETLAGMGKMLILIPLRRWNAGGEQTILLLGAPPALREMLCIRNLDFRTLRFIKF